MIPEPKKVAWGYVLINPPGRCPLILVAERKSDEDPKRTGELIIPGGVLEGNESYIERAMKETYEKTGISTVFSYDDLWFMERLDGLEREWQTTKISGRLKNGIFHLTCTDSGKEYDGKLILLRPKDEDQTPKENPKSDAREPCYMVVSAAWNERERFTPACQILLEVIQEVKLW